MSDVASVAAKAELCAFCKRLCGCSAASGSEAEQLWRCLDCGGGPACTACVERFEAIKFDGYSCDCTAEACRYLLAHPIVDGPDADSEWEELLHWPTPICTDDDDSAKVTSPTETPPRAATTPV